MTSRFYPAENVFPGHPDKLCDAIADAIVQEASQRQKRALAGVEVAVHRNRVFVTGRVACQDADTIDVDAVVREVFATAGYGDPWRPAPANLKIHTDLCLEPLLQGEEDFRRLADDQSIVTGYAIDLEGTNHLPPEHWLAWRVSRRLSGLRVERPDLNLGPDGKVFVLYEDDGTSSRLAAASASLQQEAGGDGVALYRAVLSALEEELQRAASAIPGFDPVVPEKFTVNGAGDFVVGGPEGDNGLSGKKLVVDAYGPRVPIGGGALSGKDFYKADRAGAIIARRVAKAVVLSGVARECTATVCFVPGAEGARLVALRNQDGDELHVARWSRLVDLSLSGVGDRYTGIENLVEIARQGHFTRHDVAWERLGFDSAVLC